MFVDLVDSTRLLATVDPEVVRRRVTRFFTHVTQCVGTHGGIVEKFAGDAVLAAFGIPQAHEDDAERAVRAAFGIMEGVRELGLEARIGIESGEVVTDTGDSTFATGEALNLAARLQQAAKPGEILLGPSACRLTRGRVATEDVGSLELKGFIRPVWVSRAVGTTRDVRGARPVAAPLVGRDAELDLLANTFERVVRDRRAHLVTIYGEPGVGKSRLAREFVESLEGATVLAGRSLPYGEGVTYWALAEVVKASAGIADDDPPEIAMKKLQACCEDEAIADLLALAAGVLEAVEGERSQQEIAWAARAWAEKLAEPQPLVLVFEDIHWSEDPMLELIEHLAEWVRDAPLLLLCLARPELLETRPGWGGGRVRALAVELEPLPRRESEQLVDALIAELDVPRELRESVLEKTEGNPLFVEETMRMLSEEGDGGSAERIPDTLQALIAARIDRLPPAERTVLRYASVIGRIFWGGALARLAPVAEDPGDLVDALVDREFVLREPRSSITGETAYRFKHVLIREVAYHGLAKSTRASLHARFAAWLGERAGEELVEIRAYHLDQAAALHAELDGAPPAELRTDAAAALEVAGRRAFSREAFKTARKLLRRSADLEPTLERQYLAARAAWRLADFAAVSVEMERVRAAAEEAGDKKLQGRALTALAEVALLQQADVRRARELSEQALAVLDGVVHPDTRFEALMVRGQVDEWVGDTSGAERLARQALAVAEDAGRKDLESIVTLGLASAAIIRHDFDDAETLVERAGELAAQSGTLNGRAQALAARGMLERARGNFDAAQAALEEARALFEEVGAAAGRARAGLHLGIVAFRRGDLARAEKVLRETLRTMSQLGDRGHLCEAQRRLAQVLAAAGRVDEAERLALAARETVGPEDRYSSVTTQLALGVVRAAQGRDAEAEELLRGALASFEQSHFRDGEHEALAALAGFLRERGRDDEAEPLVERLSRAAPMPTAPAVG